MSVPQKHVAPKGASDFGECLSYKHRAPTERSQVSQLHSYSPKGRGRKNCGRSEMSGNTHRECVAPSIQISPGKVHSALALEW